jgi:formylglycine-generating enzyme required for sulfatase activity
LSVPGGSFYRGYDGFDLPDQSYSATVSSFYLDRYEITVGRFRQFVESGMGTQANPPAAGAGAHPLIAGSGWNSSWNEQLAPDTNGLISNLNCVTLSYHAHTWTDIPGDNEGMPLNCLNWYTAFAFCAWDLGRLPTSTEWNYAASGGSEQRRYPWSNPPSSSTIDSSYAVYGPPVAAQRVGIKSPKGDGRWGHSDLAGNLWEWTLDWFAPYTNPCTDCANLTSASQRAMRGGGIGDYAVALLASGRGGNSPEIFDVVTGVRCARTSP